MTRTAGIDRVEHAGGRLSGPQLRVLSAADDGAQAGPSEPNPPDLGPDPSDHPTPRPWSTHFVWLLLSTLAVVLPFFAFAALFNFARWGVWFQVATIAPLVISVATVNWLMVRPLHALSLVAGRAQEDDLALPLRQPEVSPSAIQLSVSASQHASVTSQHSVTATGTAAGMRALAESSASITKSVDDLAAEAGKLRENIQRARTDLQASTDRTLANAKRVTEIQGVLELINDIADQTSLLALNAAIEAARAGDAGRGFAIVADEVRRMAERSKAAAAQIAKLANGAQATSAEAVVAIDSRGRQLDDWMSMTRAVAEKSNEVQPAVKKHDADAHLLQQAIQLIADGLRANALSAQAIASAARNEATQPMGLEGRR
jgi:methyl-accepting chemotaxis protein-like sensor